jgi:signal transduction histidine kinase/ActR/RegA family two-component response regulator
MARLAEPGQRGEAARALATVLGAADLMIFVLDAEVGAMLPAPGFLQTLPEARRWRGFLGELAGRSVMAGTLPFPRAGEETAAVGLMAVDGSALVLLGGNPSEATAGAVRDVLPVLAAAFRSERALVVAEGQAAVARQAAGQAKLLTASLENARHELQQALAEAGAANKAKDQFLAVLSHELRTPLGPVLTTATALVSDERLPADVRDAVEMIRRNADLEARLIDDLLDLTRVTRGKMPLHPTVVDVHGLIQHTQEICQSDMYRKELAVEMRLGASRRFVQADPARLQQVLWNLVKNAVKFTPAGGRLEIVTMDEGERVRIDVRDTGIGIEPQFLAKVFDAFEQTGERVTRQFGGLGLGLAISKALVDAHGGELAATSEGKGKGATFTIRLSTVPAPVETVAPAEGAGEQAPARRLRLLLVEDHRDTATVMSRLLRALGHEVTVAESVAGAVAAARVGAVDLVLSDLGLPDGSGLDLMRQLSREFGLPGVAISGYGMEDDVRHAREAGFFAHLTKPVNFQQVQAVIGQFAAEKERG